jgi:hypothetical protein
MQSLGCILCPIDLRKALTHSGEAQQTAYTTGGEDEEKRPIQKGYGLEVMVLVRQRQYGCSGRYRARHPQRLRPKRRQRSEKIFARPIFRKSPFDPNEWNGLFQGTMPGCALASPCVFP